MTELYLVRHGETAWSRTGQYTSVTDVDLTAVGREQAAALKTRLNPGDFDLVLTSPRLRARHTAELAGFGDAEVDERLAEWFYGDFEGLTADQIHQIVPGWRIWDHAVPGGETPEQVVERLSGVAQRVRDSGAERVMCFSHGHALRVLALCWIGLDIRYGGSFVLDTASVSVLGDDQGWSAVLSWNN
ncbi:MAG: histidine phosphatase family protein [Propionibacteriaceae bacterium]|jgi:probable phosphoglycerate mutase|nr:histidine phosphatase family protein [Propionibacteriaceae bacterium]